MSSFLPRILFLLIIVVIPVLSYANQVGKDQTSAKEEKMTMGDPELDVLWITEKSGEYVPLDVPFNDEEGQKVTLGEIIDRPTLLLPIYFYCPSSCSLNLMNLATGLSKSQLRPGKDFKIIAFSFNDAENSDNARIAKRNYLRLLPKNFNEKNWKFLTGSRESIIAVTDSIGYKFKAQGDGTYIHPSALVALAEDGMIIKYVYGSFVPGDIDMAVNEAQQKTPAMSIKRFLGYCFNYDPEKSRTFFQNLKLSVLLVFAFGGILFFLYLRKTGKTKTDGE